MRTDTGRIDTNTPEGLAFFGSYVAGCFLANDQELELSVKYGTYCMEKLAIRHGLKASVLMAAVRDVEVTYLGQPLAHHERFLVRKWR